jgi:hypothetical protein
MEGLTISRIAVNYGRLKFETNDCRDGSCLWKVLSPRLAACTSSVYIKKTACTSNLCGSGLDQPVKVMKQQSEREYK